MEYKLNILKDSLQMASKDKSLFSDIEIVEMEASVERLTNKLEKLKQVQSQSMMPDTNSSENVEDAGKGIGKIIKSTAKWGLAVFGVRTAYNAIRGVVNTVAGQNEQIATDLKYMSFAIATALEPIVKKIVSFVFELLQLINGIFKSLFGVDLFAGASADSFKKMSKSAEKTKKSLAGFDEMNIISDQGSAGGSGGMSSPSVDLSDSENKFEKLSSKVSDWWKKIGKEMSDALDNPQVFQRLFGGWGTLIEGVVRLFSGLHDVVTGFFQFVIGLIQLLVGIFTGNADLISKGAKKLFDGFINMINGLINIVAGVVKIIWGIIKGFIVEILGALKAIGIWILDTFLAPIGRAFAGLWNGIRDGAKEAWNGIKSAFSAAISFFTDIFNKIKSIFKDIGQKIGDVIGQSFKNVMNGVFAAIENILNFPIKAINKLIGVINKVPGINLGKLDTFTLPRMAQGGIVATPTRALIGESGAEAVIPLENNLGYLDAFAQRIAESIGGTGSSPVNVYLDGKLIQRQVAIRTEELSFATNGGV